MSRSPRANSFAWVASAVGGLLLGLAYPPSPLPLLAVFALVPLLFAWERSESARAAYGFGLVFYGTCFAVAFHWPLRHSMPTVSLASIAPLVLLVCALAVPLGVSRALRPRLGRFGGLVAFVALHLLVEAGLSRGPFALPWPLLGNALAEAEPVRLLASIGGVALLSAWLLASNILIYLAVEGPARAWFGTLAFVVLGAVVAGGSMLVPQPSTGIPVRVAIAQPSLDVRDWSNVGDRTRVDRLVAMTESLYATLSVVPDLTVWPETALPPCAGHVVCPDVAVRLTEITRPGAPPLLTGAIVADVDGTSWYNAGVLLRAGHPPDTYFKNRLVPFAEAVPFATQVPALAALGIDAGGVPAYRPGRDRRAFEVAGLKLAIMICFESVFPQEARQRSRDGADILVVLSQDGWWGSTAAHRQHLAFTRLRAIESGRPIVFAAATGTSAVIAPDGTVGAAIPFGTAAARVVEVPRSNRQTLFVRFGDWVPLAAALALAIVAGRAVLLRRAVRPG